MHAEQELTEWCTIGNAVTLVDMLQPPPSAACSARPQQGLDTDQAIIRILPVDSLQICSLDLVAQVLGVRTCRPAQRKQRVASERATPENIQPSVQNSSVAWLLSVNKHIEDECETVQLVVGPCLEH